MDLRQTLRRVFTIPVLIATLLLPATTALAEELRWESEITYSADLDKGLLHMSADMTVTNLMANTRSGNVITSYYYDRLSLYVPDTAINMVATSNGRELTYTLEEVEDPDLEGFVLAEIKFGRRLLYKQKMTLGVEFDVAGDPPRTESIFRINPAYVSFAVLWWGDPGRVSVNVVLPSSFYVDFDDVEHTYAYDGENTVYKFGDDEMTEEFFLWVQGWDETGMAVFSPGLDSFDVAVKGWPNDPDWSREVLDTVTTGLPVLQELVGLDWHPRRTVDILESHDVALAGYAGWYLELEQDIYVAEWVDPHLVLHELSHTWFNEDLFEERWITEGLADEFAAEATQRAGMESVDFPRPTETPDEYPGGLWLNDWEVPDPDRADLDRYEEYGYETSFWIVQQVASEIGHEALADVLYAAENDEIAYRQSGDTETVDADVDDWRRFLDLLQEVGGSETAPELFAEFVTGEDLTARTEAREAYADLVDEGWQIPFYVRQPMENWEFDMALDRMSEATELIETRDLIEANAGLLEVEPPNSLQTAFEGASTSFTEASQLADAQNEAAENVVAAMTAVNAERTFTTTLGLIGTDPELEYAQAVDAFEVDDPETANLEAAEVVALIADADDVGLTRLMIAVGSILALAGIAAILIIRPPASGRIRP